MTKVELIAAVANEANLTKKDAEAAVNGALNAITNALKEGDKVTLVGFGTFEVRERPVSRVIKRRTLANEVADAGRVLVNGKPAKASYTVKVGDIIEVTFGNRPVKIRVLSDVEQKGKDVAREMFEIIED